MKLRGCGTALVTPFKSDTSVDEEALRALVAWQVEWGADDSAIGSTAVIQGKPFTIIGIAAPGFFFSSR